MTGLTHITEKEFQQRVLAAKTPVLVEFGATWCVPCRRLEPILMGMQDEFAGRLELFQIDVDEDPDLAMKYQVMGVPAMILFKGGNPLERLTGLVPRERILAKITPHLSPA
jgi:thioredoxin 1